jgi:hypothetical protein
MLIGQQNNVGQPLDTVSRSMQAGRPCLATQLDIFVSAAKTTALEARVRAANR